MRESKSERAGPKLVLVVFLFASFLIGGCDRMRRTPDTNRPPEDILAIVNEVQFERGRDIYRMPYPRDAEGKNLYRSSLDRLEDWRRLHPDKFEDIVAFAQGICYRNLAQIEDAAASFQAVRTEDRDLQGAAVKQAEAMEDLLQAFRPALEWNDETALPNPSFDPNEAARARAEMALEKYKDTEWENLTWVLAENQAVEACRDLRSRRSGGSARDYEHALEEVIVRFSESKRINQHRMRLGRYYEETMREWLTQAEYGNDAKAWELAGQALKKTTEIYGVVAQADGFPEKPEAQKRLALLEEDAQRIENRL